MPCLNGTPTRVPWFVGVLSPPSAVIFVTWTDDPYNCFLGVATAIGRNCSADLEGGEVIESQEADALTSRPITRLTARGAIPHNAKTEN